MSVAHRDVQDRRSIETAQRHAFRALLQEIVPANPFYARKLVGLDLHQAELGDLPFTTKAELAADRAAYPLYGSGLTYPADQYSRLSQTSGTMGQPLRWLDTSASWNAMLDCWEAIYGIVDIQPADRLLFAFSFGPFLGFWTAFDSAARRGNLCLTGGGMSSSARLRFLLDNQATVVLGTPTYALRLAEVAQAEGLNLAQSSVRALIVAGEPGGGVAAIRQRIEAAWGARVYDHYGMTEVGPVAIECTANPGGLHILDTDYLAEVVDPQTGQSVAAGQIGELVLTNLARLGSPVIRYRTGDQVRIDPRPCPCGRVLTRLEGGILGRTDDMIHLRGNNLYPAALEATILRFAEVAEYRVEVDASGTLTELSVSIEPFVGGQILDLAERIGRAIRDEFLFRAEVKLVEPGSLPRFEMKAKRVVRKD